MCLCQLKSISTIWLEVKWPRRKSKNQLTNFDDLEEFIEEKKTKEIKKIRKSIAVMLHHVFFLFVSLICVLHKPNKIHKDNFQNKE